MKALLPAQVSQQQPRFLLQPKAIATVSQRMQSLLEAVAYLNGTGCCLLYEVASTSKK